MLTYLLTYLFHMMQTAVLLCGGICKASSSVRRWVLIQWRHVPRWWHSSVLVWIRRLVVHTLACASTPNSSHWQNSSGSHVEWLSNWQNVDSLVTFYILLQWFLSRISILTRDIDIANLSICPSVCLSIRYVPVSDENGLTYHHSFFTIW